jgi:hypothetical protein
VKVAVYELFQTMDEVKAVTLVEHIATILHNGHARWMGAGPYSRAVESLDHQYLHRTVAP